MRRRRLLLALAALAALPLLALAWLLGSESGLRFVLARATAALPELELSAERVEGRLGAMRLERLRLQAAGRPIELRGLALEWQPLALLAGRLSLDHLQFEALEIGAARSAEPAAEPFDPERLVWTYPLSATPLPVSLARAQLGPARLDGQLLWQRLELEGELDGAGRLRLARFTAHRGEDRLDLRGQLPAGRLDPGLHGHWRGSGSEGSVALTADHDGASLLLRGDDGRAELAASVQAPHSWQLRLSTAKARLAALFEGLPEPLDLQLQIEGDGARARLSASTDTGPLPLRSLDGELQWEAARQRLQINALSVEHAGGGSLAGSAGLQLGAEPELELALRLTGWPLAGDASDAPRLFGELLANGPLQALPLRLQGELRRDALYLPLTLDARLEGERLQIEGLRLAGPHGRMDARGALQFAPELALQLDIESEQLDPGWLDPNLDGVLSLQARLRVEQQAKRWRARLELPRLEGRWRSAALSGSGDLRWADEVIDGQLQLTLGDGRLRLDASSDGLLADLKGIDLGALHADLAGRLQGQLRLRPPLTAPGWDADLRLQGLAFGPLRAEQVDLRGGLGEGSGQTLELVLHDAAYAQTLQQVSGRLQLTGSLAEQRAELRLDAPGLRVEADGQSSLQPQRTLALERLLLHSAKAGDWQLAQPARLSLSPELLLEPLCLESDGARLCAETATNAGAQLALSLQSLPLRRLLALTKATDLDVEGELSARATLRVNPDPALDSARLTLGRGRVSDRGGERPVELLAWDALDAQLGVDGERLQLTLESALLPEGRLHAQLLADAAAPLDSARWEGTLGLDLPAIPALALLAPDIVDARAALHGQMRWQPGQPPEGELRLQPFTARVPALGLSLREASLSLRQDEQGLQLDGLVDSGEGPLRIEGLLQPGAQPSAKVRLAGQGVLLADTRRLSLRASPDLSIDWRPERLRLRGELGIPRALIDLEKLEAGVQTSPDVVVLDPRENRRGAAALPLDVDLRVTLGDDVRLAGFGFEGDIRGALSLREQPGRPMLARGSLELGGSYRAYNQSLEIERGRLLYTSSPLDNPGIDLRARRPLREVEVGVEVRGPARRPQLSLWSKPALEQAEALSWLILGRPLASASQADGAQLGQAAAAMGGNLLAARVGDRLGFDTFGVADSDALGGAAFTVGKYLSPRLYLSYGVALFESGQVLTLRYLISRSFDVELESARESRIGVNYQVERD